MPHTITSDAVIQDFDNTQAFEEGWGIFDCEGSENDQWQLQKSDEDAVFASDEDAWLFVVDHAIAGSAYHIAALDWLERHAPMELDCIHKACRS